MKRKLILSIFAALLAVAMLLPLTSCGLIEQNGGNETAAPTQGPQIVPTPSKEVTNDSSSDVEPVFPDLPPEEIVQGAYRWILDTGCDPSFPYDIVYQIPKTVSREDKYVPVKVFFGEWGLNLREEGQGFFITAETQQIHYYLMDEISYLTINDGKCQVLLNTPSEETGLPYTCLYSKTYLVPISLFERSHVTVNDSNRGIVRFCAYGFNTYQNQGVMSSHIIDIEVYCKFEGENLIFSSEPFR